MWTRLVWKEYRQGWPVLLLGIALPGLALWRPVPADARAFEGVVQSRLVMTALLLAIVAAWSVTRVMARGPEGAGARLALPLPGPARWVDLYLLPLPIPLLVGAVMGLLAARGMGGRTEDVPLAVALFLVNAFLLTTLATEAFGAAVAVLAGVCWLFAYDGYQPAGMLPLYLRLLAGLPAAALLWALLRRRGRLARAAVTAVLLGVLLGPGLARGDWNYLVLPAGESADLRDSYLVYPGDLVQGLDFQPDAMAGDRFLLTVSKEGARIGVPLRVERYARPVAVLPDGDILLAQQRPGERALRLLAWDTAAGTVTRRATLRLWPKALADCNGSSVSPDGRRLLLAFSSRLNRGSSFHVNSDLWLIDLDADRARLLGTGMKIYLGRETVAWTPARVCLAYPGHPAYALSPATRPLLIDLRTARARPLRLREP